MAHDDSNFDAIFCDAIEITSTAERAAFIARACGPDEELRLRVERLVDAHIQGIVTAVRDDVKSDEHPVGQTLVEDLERQVRDAA